MSRLRKAKAIVLPRALVIALADAVAARQHEKFRELLRSDQAQRIPDCIYSARVITIAQEYVEEQQGIMFLGLATDETDGMFAGDIEPILMISGADAPIALRALRDARLEDDVALQEYFRQATWDDWEEAPEAMRAAVRYLESAVEGADTSDKWALVFTEKSI